jgi:hypothetical protein
MTVRLPSDVERRKKGRTGNHHAEHNDEKTKSEQFGEFHDLMGEELAHQKGSIPVPFEAGEKGLKLAGWAGTRSQNLIFGKHSKS